MDPNADPQDPQMGENSRHLIGFNIILQNLIIPNIAANQIRRIPEFSVIILKPIKIILKPVNSFSSTAPYIN